MSAVTASARDRRTEVRRLIDSMEHAKVISDGHFSALGMLITDASLSADEPALVECQDGLQWLHRHYLDVDGLDGAQREQRGRILGLIDVVHWALRRLPSGLQLGLRPESHAARFLVAVHRRQGMSNKQLSAELGTDETEVSRVGRRLLSAGLVWRRKEWRHNAWDITPRGFQYLETSGLLAEGADGGRRAAGPGRGEELAPRSPDAVPRRPGRDAPEPDRAEAGLPEPGFAETDLTEPGRTEPGRTEPGHTEAGHTEPGPSSSQPGHA
ncbi:hypothetical protein [Actinomadura chibensis]|uniref:Uncharacterized protein n=1 Tax=Actinomadura chibensis TaxID=392828 RepID=A0A5D0NA54_9ACTN|nr:hypothetical protein [Actinomadura chibensis]TYB41199.1 hypothetical protein FXF69_37485 [Actinomadura chibensis]